MFDRTQHLYFVFDNGQRIEYMPGSITTFPPIDETTTSATEGLSLTSMKDVTFTMTLYDPEQEEKISDFEPATEKELAEFLQGK